MERAETGRSRRRAIRARRQTRLKETTVAISDKKLVEMIEEFEADPYHRNWCELKAALLARGNAPIVVPRGMRDRMESGEPENPERFARARRLLSN
jgi:hypothetical protein